MLASLFERCMKRRGVKESDAYDWEKSNDSSVGGVGAAVVSTAVSGGGQSNLPTNIQNHTKMKNEPTIQGNITQMTVAGSNGSGLEYVSTLLVVRIRVLYYLFSGKKFSSFFFLCGFYVFFVFGKNIFGRDFRLDRTIEQPQFRLYSTKFHSKLVCLSVEYVF